MKPFFNTLDGNGEITFARPAPDYVDVRVLAATTNEAHTVPTGAQFVIFSSDGDFFARPNATAAVPGADVTDGTGSELNPTIWHLGGVTTINLIASSARTITMSFYKSVN